MAERLDNRPEISNQLLLGRGFDSYRKLISQSQSTKESVVNMTRIHTMLDILQISKNKSVKNSVTFNHLK